MKQTRTKNRPIVTENDFVEACSELWGDLTIDWGFHLNKKHFKLYEELLEKFHTSAAFTEEVEVHARLLWQIANSPLAKALNEEE